MTSHPQYFSQSTHEIARIRVELILVEMYLHILAVKKHGLHAMRKEGWMDKLIKEVGLSDVYRLLHPDTTAECYTWWSNRGQAWANNVGWRLDYHLATQELAKNAKASSVYKEERFSDHAPLPTDH